jgi:MtN3 and saliva related transmembrane protein
LPHRIIVDASGAAAAVCSSASFVPQLARLLRERAAEAVSIRMYALTVTAFLQWSAYGLMQHSWPLVASNLVSLGLASAILALRLGRRAAGSAPGDRP